MSDMIKGVFCSKIDTQLVRIFVISVAIAAIMAGWNLERLRKTVQNDMRYNFPVLVFTRHDQKSDYKPKLVWYKVLVEYLRANPDHTFLIPKNFGKTKLKKEILVPGKTKNIKSVKYKIEEERQGYQYIKLSLWENDENPNNGWYEAEDKRIKPRYHQYYWFGPNWMGLYIFGIFIALLFEGFMLLITKFTSITNRFSAVLDKESHIRFRRHILKGLSLTLGSLLLVLANIHFYKLVGHFSKINIIVSLIMLVWAVALIRKVVWAGMLLSLTVWMMTAKQMSTASTLLFRFYKSLSIPDPKFIYGSEFFISLGLVILGVFVFSIIHFSRKDFKRLAF